MAKAEGRWLVADSWEAPGRACARLAGIQRVSVVGPSGCGKTTFATRLSTALGLPRLELDAIHWQQNWTPLDTETLRARVDEFTSGDLWVVDGNYAKVRDIVRSRTDTVVWLRPNRVVVTRRLLRRSIGRVALRRTLWNGNRERLSDLLDLRDPEHLIRWSIPKLADRYGREMADPELDHLSWVVLETPYETERFLTTLSTT